MNRMLISILIGKLSVMHKYEEMGKEMAVLGSTWNTFLYHMEIMKCKPWKDKLGQILGKLDCVRRRGK